MTITGLSIPSLGLNENFLQKKMTGLQFQILELQKHIASSYYGSLDFTLYLTFNAD